MSSDGTRDYDFNKQTLNNLNRLVSISLLLNLKLLTKYAAVEITEDIFKNKTAIR